MTDQTDDVEALAMVLADTIPPSGLDDSFDHHDQASPAEYNTLTDEYTWPDGPVICDWDDGILWRYVAPEALTGGDHG